jgi:pyruvate,water dikinase
VKNLDAPQNLDLIKGLPASLGKAVGRAKVVRSVKDIGKVEEGDILIAVMTRPDYVIGMKKAAAIVTDEGGLTCHAAIVARELRVPCVIATKIASRVIKDGDKVEVDANVGEVRIIS